jgi:hypothetical protein
MDKTIIKEYNVFSSSSIHDRHISDKNPKEIIGLKTIINLRIKYGWTPQGGIMMDPHTCLFYQAMTRN